MSYGQLNSVDKIHANLLEIGKQIRRLKWLVIIISFFFGYLALRYETQPDYFEISFLGKLSISKTDVILFGPVIVALLNLALGLAQSYSLILIRHFSEILLSDAYENSVNANHITLLQYPTTDALFAVLSSDNKFTPFYRKLFAGLGFVVRISFSILSIGAYIVVIWKGFRYSPSTLIDCLLFLSVIPLAFSLFILLHHDIVIFAVTMSNLITRLVQRVAQVPRPAIPIPLKSNVVSFIITLALIFSGATIYTSFFRPPRLIVSSKISNIVNLSQLPDLSIQVGGKQVRNLKMIAMTIENKGRKTANNIQLSYLPPEKGEVLLVQVVNQNQVKEYTGASLISLGNLKPTDMIKIFLLVTNISNYDLEKLIQEMLITSGLGYPIRIKLTN